ncbi:hypothetical protein BGZ65_006894 [Modicella reniformis]|uniref:PWI domain-containing protein n=1 Tax=Modicella reniformis TaxID=1440133 RepID=A0A9P6MB93_9FUNG|nr:hypothetical protein BGZ65_006894 [Modicella reniformis]
MGDAGFFKGTSADQDARFSDKQKKLLRSMHFPPEFNQKIDMKKVNLSVMKGWMVQRVNQLLGIDDEVVVEYAFGMLEEESPDPKTMQINLQGFLDKNAQVFVLELWKLLLSAQNSLGGIPQQFLDQTKEDLLQAKARREYLLYTRLLDACTKSTCTHHERAKEAELAKIREQEENERAVAEELKRKAQAIRDAARPKASSSFENEGSKDSKTTPYERDRVRDRRRDGYDRSRSRDESRRHERRHDRYRERSRDRHDRHDEHYRSSRRRSRTRSRSRGRGKDHSRERRSHRDHHGRDRSRDRERARERDRNDRERDRGYEKHRDETKRRRVHSTSRSKSRSRSNTRKPSKTTTAKSRTQSPESGTTDNAESGPRDGKDTQNSEVIPEQKAGPIDSQALENQLREQLLRERVVKSVKHKNASQADLSSQ